MQRAPDMQGIGALSRRRFLRWGLVGVGIVGTALGGLRWMAGSVPHVPGLRVLSDRQHATLAALLRTLFPNGAMMRESELRALTRVADNRLAHLPAETVKQVQLALLYVELAPVLLERRRHTFCQLDDASRDAHWRTHWELTGDDLRRGAGTSLRRLTSSWVYDASSLWPRIHYPGPVLQAMELP